MLKKYAPWVILVFIILIAGYLRLYRIRDYMGFLGDEGRDALVVEQMIVHGKLTLLGPITSVGLMHLGPMYYYFMAPFLWAARLDPVGPAIMVALFSLATILLLWKLSVEFFNKKVAFVACIGYALSPLVITYSHSSWNPNVLPFWALLIIYGLLKVYVQKNYKYLFLVGTAIGIALQLHYIALVFIPISLAVIAISGNIKSRQYLKYIFWWLVGTVLTYSPFILFEIRHKFINTLTTLSFVTRTGDAKTFAVGSISNKFWDLSVRLFWRLMVIKSAEVSILLLLFTFGLCLWSYRSLKKTSAARGAIAVLLIWFVVGIGFLSLYSGSVYDYYLMFAFPLPFLLLGIALDTISHKKVGIVIAVIVVGVLSYNQIQVTPILKDPNRLVAQTEDIANFILDKAGGKPFNFALIAGRNSDHAYRYFLEIGKNPPVEILNEVVDPKRTSTTDQLFVVCEEAICQPLGHPLWEIAGYGRAEISGQWKVGLFQIFKLVKYQAPAS
jgi:4-amino-4-deoxy-L-arabinose transferase-like glycosyltransferase